MECIYCLFIVFAHHFKNPDKGVEKNTCRRSINLNEYYVALLKVTPLD